MQGKAPLAAFHVCCTGSMHCWLRTTATPKFVPHLRSTSGRDGLEGAEAEDRKCSFSTLARGDVTLDGESLPVCPGARSRAYSRARWKAGEATGDAVPFSLRVQLCICICSLRILSFSCFAGNQAPFYRLLVPQPVKICPGLFFFYQQKASIRLKDLRAQGRLENGYTKRLLSSSHPWHSDIPP
jgi:hypothetical protein